MLEGLLNSFGSLQVKVLGEWLMTSQKRSFEEIPIDMVIGGWLKVLYSFHSYLLNVRLKYSAWGHPSQRLTCSLNK